jgi:hypothetical protein
MSSIRNVGGSGTPPVNTESTAQSQQTSQSNQTSQTTSTSSSESVQSTRSGGPQPQGSTQTPTGQTGGPPAGISPRDASQRRAEHDLSGVAQQAALRGGPGPTGASASGTATPAAPVTPQSVATTGRNLGLTAAESTQLRNTLNAMPAAERRTELQFLQRHVLTSTNPDRALRTYMDLRTQHDAHPTRITNDVVHDLTRGVAHRRTDSSRGREGILTQESANQAARAMVGMSQRDYHHLQASVHDAGQRNGRTAPGSYPLGERALIYKAVGARADQLTNPTIGDRVRNAIGLPSTAMRDVQTYAGQIQGMRHRDLIDQSTVQDLRDNNRAEALQQRFEDSCAPTSAQITRAEVDPIYARQLHQNAIHGIAGGNPIATEQSTLLNAGGGGVGTARPGPAGGGLSDPSVTTTLNNHVGPATNGRVFNYQNYPDNNSTPATRAASQTARGNALNRIDAQLRRGHDVPIGVTWNGGGGHVVVMTDVRGQGNNRQYLVSDPYTGQTQWIRHRDIVNGNTNFMAGRGVMDASWE